MPELIHWPPTLVARATNLRVRPATRSAGEAINGFEQVGSALSAKWTLDLTFNTLKRHLILAYRATLAAMNGRENWLRFPIHDGQLAPELGGSLAPVPHSDGAYFSDGSGYVVGDVAGVVVVGELGAKSMTVDLSEYGDAFTAGQYFGAGDDLHIATSVLYDAAGVATVRFEPAFRRDHDGSTFRLRPYLICRAASDDTGDHSIEWGRATSPSWSWWRCRMSFFPETIAAALAGAHVRAAFLFLFEFDEEPVRVFQGFGKLRAGGQLWDGIGNVASVSGLEQPVQGQAPQAQFVFSGVDAQIVRLTRDEFEAKARFRKLRVFLQWMADDEDRPNVLYDQPVQFWSGTMMDPQFDITGPSTRRITIKCESIFANRSRPNFSMNTDADQQRRYPGDRGMEFVGGLRNKIVTWPDF